MSQVFFLATEYYHTVYLRGLFQIQSYANDPNCFPCLILVFKNKSTLYNLIAWPENCEMGLFVW